MFTDIIQIIKINLLNIQYYYCYYSIRSLHDNILTNIVYKKIKKYFYKEDFYYYI